MASIRSLLLLAPLLAARDPMIARGSPGAPNRATGAAALDLVAAGESSWTIVLPDECTPQEREAASRLSALVAEMTEVTLPVRREAEAPDADRILVGDTRTGLALAAKLGIDRDALGEDGFAIRAAGRDLLLVSGPPDGAPTEPLGIVYAVNHLLEAQLGVRYWAPGALDVPRADAVALPADLAITESPPIWFRQVNYGPANDSAYRRWHKLDRVQEEVGRLWAPRWVHSSFHHVDPDEHFEQHPEYFSLVGDRRTPSQLCLTNPRVLALVVRSFERTFEDYPNVRYISFSQQDNHGACACAACSAIDEREGTQMGSLLTFVNALAERFPERIISTLAYQYSRKPPRTVRPRPNVSIMLCTIEEDRARPIATNPRSTFAADLAGWTALTDDIFLWDYEVQFASPVAPFPNLRTLSPNVRWFADAGVRHVFLQGNGLRTEFAELRCYLLAKLAWDPDCDVEATIDDFLVGYYGAAAVHLRAYIDLIHDELAASGEELVLYGNPALAMESWLRPEVLAAANGHFDAAEAAVRAQTGHAARVRTARLPLMYAELEIAKRLGARPGGIWGPRGSAAKRLRGGGMQPRRRVRERLDAFLAGCERAGIARLREYDLTLETYRADWERLLDPGLPDHLAFGATIESRPRPSAKYAHGDVRRLVDGLPGARPGPGPVTRAFRENWVGWEGTDAVIAVFPARAANGWTRLSFHALQEPRSWIWLPRSIVVEGRGPDSDWRPIATLTHDVDERANRAHPFEVDLTEAGPLTGLRLTFDALETCPAWHLGAGRPSWFFLDELRVDGVQSTLHVSPDGKDDAEGTAQRPLATPGGARDRIRAWRRDDDLRTGQIRVVLHAGEYRFDSSMTLTEQDSGTSDTPIVYAAAPGERVRFVGGCTLAGDQWKDVDAASTIGTLANPEVARHIRQLDLHAAGILTSDTIHPRGFPQPVRAAPMELFFDDRPMTLARYPNEGFVHTGNVIEAGSVAVDGGPPERLPVFTFSDDRLSRWGEAGDIWLYGYWKWDWADESIRVAGIDPKTRQITLAAPHSYGVHAGQPFYAENLLQELDQPGEYYIDREAGMVYFWPPAAIESAECRVSTLAGPLIHFDSASHVRFEGIVFEFARGDAIRIDDGTNVIIADCGLRNLGNRAVVVEGGSGHLIDRCDIERTGEGGITLDGGDRRSLTPCHHRVSDCRIRDFSRRTATYRPAVRLGGVGCRVDHCELSDAPHAAILFGGNDHVIEYNDIHHVLTRTGDGGAVYCGRDWTIRGTVIRRNHFHDLAGIRKWENAVYIDDQASGIVIRENLFTDCHWGMLVGGGRDNVIEGNVFIDCGLALHFDARGLGWAARMLGTLTERLEAVPYRDEPWARRFPRLLTILEDEPMVPKGNVIRGNLLIRSGRIDQDMAGEVKAAGIVAGNQSRDHEPGGEDPSAAILRSIPLEEIGPRRH